MELVDRDTEIAVLGKDLVAAQSGNGRLVVVRGEPGIGKSSLLAWLRQRAIAAGTYDLRSVAGELEQDLSFGVVRQMLEPQLKRLSPATLRRVTHGAASLAAPVVGRSGRGDTPSMTGVIHGLYWLCSNLADQAPLLLTVDDAQWADAASIRFLSHLARRIEDLPALLVLTVRDAAGTQDTALAEVLATIRRRELRLAPLSVGAVTRLVRQHLGDSADDQFTIACARATVGNPFLLTEALLQLKADDVLPTESEAHRIDRLKPDLITANVMSRIGKLGPNSLQVARAAAVLGPAANLRFIAGLADPALEPTAAMLDALAREHIVTTRQPTTITHPLLRSTIYLDMAEPLRAMAHKRAARMLAEEDRQDELVPHLLAALCNADPWTVGMLEASSRQSLALGAPETAVACLRRALQEPPPDSSRIPLLFDLGRTLGMLSRPAEAESYLDQALELTNDADLRLSIMLAKGRMMAMMGEVGRAGQLYEDAVRDIEAAGGRLTPQAMSETVITSRLANLEPPRHWMPALAEVLAAAKDHATSRMVLSTLAFGAAGTQAQVSAAVAALAERAAEGPLPPEPWLLINFASGALTVADQFDAAIDLLDRGIALARTTGDVTAFGFMSVLRSHSIRYAGNLLEAEADARAALAIYQSGPQDTVLPTAMLIDALVDQGDHIGAQAALEECAGAQQLSFIGLLDHFLLMARGRLRVRQRQWADAVRDLRTCGDGLLTAGYYNPSFAEWRAELAEAHHQAGDMVLAQSIAAENLHLARTFGAPRSLSAALRVSARVADDDERELLEEAVEVATRSSAKLEQAQTLIAYGGCLRRLSERKSAQDTLRHGLQLATACGAVGLAGFARDELLATGARPRRVAVVGPAALTASESRVCSMAIAGTSNRDIAQSLFITKRTVEVHLSSSYRKLGITSRNELANALG